MEELSHLLQINSNGLATFEGVAAYGEQVRFWMNTPQGQIWGRPSWGNPFVDFKFMDVTEDSCIEMELKILSAIKRDLPDVPIMDVSVTLPHETDKQTFLIQIILDGEIITTTVTGGSSSAA